MDVLRRNSWGNYASKKEKKKKPTQRRLLARPHLLLFCLASLDWTPSLCWYPSIVSVSSPWVWRQTEGQRDQRRCVFSPSVFYILQVFVQVKDLESKNKRNLGVLANRSSSLLLKHLVSDPAFYSVTLWHHTIPQGCTFAGSGMCERTNQSSPVIQDGKL